MQKQHSEIQWILLLRCFDHPEAEATIHWTWIWCRLALLADAPNRQNQSKADRLLLVHIEHDMPRPEAHRIKKHIKSIKGHAHHTASKTREKKTKRQRSTSGAAWGTEVSLVQPRVLRTKLSIFSPARTNAPAFQLAPDHVIPQISSASSSATGNCADANWVCDCASL